MTRLDIVFANYYFDALRAGTSAGPDAAPPVWRPLFRNRTRPKITRIQFALAGVNAHIERDLVFALLDMYREDGEAPNKDSIHYSDYFRANQNLDGGEIEVK